MHRPLDPDSSEMRAWLESNDRPRRLAEWLFRTEHADDANCALSHASTLARMPVENLDLDLTDPAQRAFGDYELLERIGRGGMGVVYRARQLSLDRDVALKVLAAGPWAGVDFIDGLRNEARHAARLAHPHIVSVFDVGQHDAFYFYTMRLVVGESLRERLARVGTISTGEAVRIALSIARALTYAHGIGVLHLDIKPANILLDGDGEAHLADFGLAQCSDRASREPREQISGTPQYMAPEQAQGTGRALGAAADIYALGATLFEMLSGQPAMQANSPRQMVQQLLKDDMPRLRDVVPRADRELDAICARCMAREPARRYANASELADDLRRSQLHRPVRAMRNRWLYRAGKFLRRNRLASALSALVVVIVAVAMVAMAWQVRQTAREAARTLQIKDQLIELFLQPEDAKWGKGDKSAMEFLGQASSRLDGLPFGSELRGEIAGVLVGIYVQFAQYERAATLAERELGGTPVTPNQAANADLRLVTGWANARWVIDQPNGVSAALASALASARDTHSNVYLEALITQTRMSILVGDFTQAVSSGEKTLALLHERSANPRDVVSARMELAAAYVGDRQAIRGREQSELALKEVGATDSFTHIQATTMAGLRRALFGDFAAAQEVFDDGAGQLQRLQIKIPALFEKTSYAVNAFDLGLIDDARKRADQLIGELDAIAPGERGSGRADMLWLRGEIALHQERNADAALAFEECAADLRPIRDRRRTQAIYCAALEVVAMAHAGKSTAARRLLLATQQLTHPPLRPDYSTSMLIASEAVLLGAEGRHAEAVRTFNRALAEFEAGRREPSVLENQLKENRDAVRLRTWKAQAQRAVGDLAGAATTAAAAKRIGISSLGINHPAMQELAAVQGQLSTGK